VDCRHLSRNAVYGRIVAAQKKRRRPAPPGASPESRVAILLEDIQGKVQATMEAVTGFRSEFRSEIDTLRAELIHRIELLELVVRQNAADIRELQKDVKEVRGEITEIREDIREMREDIRRNTEEIRELRELVARKSDRETLLRLEARVQVLEQRLGIASERPSN